MQYPCYKLKNYIIYAQHKSFPFLFFCAVFVNVVFFINSCSVLIHCNGSHYLFAFEWSRAIVYHSKLFQCKTTLSAFAVNYSYMSNCILNHNRLHECLIDAKESRDRLAVWTPKGLCVGFESLRESRRRLSEIRSLNGPLQLQDTLFSLSYMLQF